MRQYLKNEVFKASKWLEFVLSVIIMIAVFGGAVWLVGDLVGVLSKRPDSEAIYQFVGAAFNLVICIEFVKMLCKHTPDTLVEVVMFAIARQMIIEHTTAIENMIGVAAIAVLFAVRKFLFDEFDSVDKTSFFPKEKVKRINELIHVRIPEDTPGQTIGEAIEAHIEKEGEKFYPGQCYEFPGGAARVESVSTNGRVLSIEIIHTKNAWKSKR